MDTATTAGAGAIGIDFVGQASAMRSGEVAGVVPRARWNAASKATRTTPLALLDEFGATTGATVTWAADTIESTRIINQSGHYRLMRGYVEGRGNQTARVVVSGLAAGTYDIYVYVDGDNGGARRTATYQVSGAGLATTSVDVTDAANANYTGTFSLAQNSAGNYAKFTITASGFTLTAIPGSSSKGPKRAPLNGIQIVPVSSPTSFRLSGVISPTAAGAGTTVNLGGSGTATTVVDASGTYSFSSLPSGPYSVMPARAGYVFTPPSRNVTIAGTDLVGLDFYGTPSPNTYTIRGIISPASAGGGTTVTLNDPLASVTTTADSAGNYVFAVLSNGAYTVTPAKEGYAFTPAFRNVTVSDANVTSVNFTALGPTMTRANSYDDAWQSAWVSHGRALLAAPGKTAGFVLEIGDSITHSRAYSAWAIGGQGKTADDAQAMTWARASAWSGTTNDVTNKNGFYLTGADTTTQRGMTSSGGISTGELVLGCCNNGPTMPSETSPPTARQVIVNTTYIGNIQIDTLIAAFGDAQFAVVMLGTNDPENPNGLEDLTAIVDRLEGAGILAILSTIPPRNDAYSDQFNVTFNTGVRTLAQNRSLPLIDFYQEIVLRRPGTTWFSTLISSDGVHPTGDRAGYTVTSNPYLPGGDPATHTTGDAPANVGYLLRSWLTVQKLKEVKLYVVDGINP